MYVTLCFSQLGLGAGLHESCARRTYMNTLLLPTQTVIPQQRLMLEGGWPGCWSQKQAL